MIKEIPIFINKLKNLFFIEISMKNFDYAHENVKRNIS